MTTQTHTNSLFRANIHGFVRCPTFPLPYDGHVADAAGEEGLWVVLLGKRCCNFGSLSTSLLRLSEATGGRSGLLWSHYFFRSCWLQLWHRVFTGKRLRQVSGGATNQQWGQWPSTMTKIVQQGCLGSFCESLRPEGQSIRWQCSPCSRWTKLISDPYKNLRKSPPALSSVKSMFTPWNITLVLRVSMYSVWNQTTFAVRMLPANYYASSVASRMHHMAFDLLASILGLIWRLLSVSPISSQLTPMSFPWFCRPSSAMNIKIAARLLFFSFFTVTLLDSDLLSVCKNVTKEKEVRKVNFCYTKDYIKPNR